MDAYVKPDKMAGGARRTTKRGDGCGGGLADGDGYCQTKKASRKMVTFSTRGLRGVEQSMYFVTQSLKVFTTGVYRGIGYDIIKS
jgi:hypothetical protein